MNKTPILESDGNRCPKCGKLMDTKRSDAEQCRSCRRAQQDKKSHEIKKRKRGLKAFSDIETKVEESGIKELIEKDILLDLEKSLEDANNVSKEDFDFLKNEIVYGFEKRDLPKVQDERLRRLREGEFKDIFDKVKQLTSS
jgi:DNA-directed RNA polymerase subunit M/transcription elongation factor TFIIS